MSSDYYQLLGKTQGVRAVLKKAALSDVNYFCAGPVASAKNVTRVASENRTQVALTRLGCVFRQSPVSGT